VACAIRGNNDIKGIKLPGEPGGKKLEAKFLARCLSALVLHLSAKNPTFERKQIHETKSLNYFFHYQNHF
jgi:hypothetical protein